MAYNSEHLFSSRICGFSRSQLIQTGPAQLALLHLSPIIFGKGDKQRSVLLSGMTETQEYWPRCPRALQPFGHAIPTNVSLAKANLAELKVKV